MVDWGSGAPRVRVRVAVWRYCGSLTGSPLLLNHRLQESPLTGCRTLFLVLPWGCVPGRSLRVTPCVTVSRSNCSPIPTPSLTPAKGGLTVTFIFTSLFYLHPMLCEHRRVDSVCRKMLICTKVVYVVAGACFHLFTLPL